MCRVSKDWDAGGEGPGEVRPAAQRGGQGRQGWQEGRALLCRRQRRVCAGAHICVVCLCMCVHSVCVCIYAHACVYGFVHVIVLCVYLCAY